MTCDELHRVVIPEAVPGRKYRVTGLTLEPVGDHAQPKPLEWDGPKLSLAEHLRGLFAEGFEFPETPHDPVPPCPF